MITVREFRNIVNQCPKDWTITFQKWEHVTTEELSNRSYKMPNLLSVCLNDIKYIKTNDGDVIYKIILKEDFDNDFTMTPIQCEQIFCGTKDDYDLLDFVLCVEDIPRHYDYVRLSISAGDKGYSNKNMKINLEEV